ncbi:Dolichyl N-acetyl-alpha-D-glucosaminyl phosphate 3-beta-D-2,3-diacetamido-2,3-dideoxy-beta-D-glucuronosyltransferase [Metallosphaera sp. J1]|uniref:glycosyltransferase n=1 Tax=Metallosphaera javensis (ex Hofmann et al. 2022) TaxID=99938 RepID=UPI001EDFE877|nr:glycosyltransferase [Metallosphaera javensis (ex Hofmann et al. 2022)]MCG3109375.1 Dolichyl N-acetyl-alpha-D-glucosaminyl phosphate 3-beta-D-2,3-diacetamido-2,3-dideoxy-beta-D-glucuronosyltransferase [Metallosphaera javensis (ex Hofmann et al. 2022)]
MLDDIVVGLSIIVSIWSVYNSAFAIYGLSWRSSEPKSSSGPSFSLLVPARNEEKVLGRLLERLLNQEYDRSKYEIIVLEDGSTDNTLGVCNKFSEMYSNVKCVHLEKADVVNGKSRALNYGLKLSKGEIIGVFDADTVPRLDVLGYVAQKFSSDPRVGGVQGRLIPINVRESIVARLASLEELFSEYSISGRARAGLFVPLEGTCSFVRRDALERVGGWNENVLTEDLDLSLKLTSLNYMIVYSPSVQSWREVPTTFVSLVRQRLRWYRGNFELTLRISKFKLTWKLIDAAMLVGTPVFMVLSLANYSLVFIYSYQLHILIATIVSLSSIMTLTLIIMISRRHMIETIYILLSALYLNFTISLHLVSIVLELTGAPKGWSKTERSGNITVDVPRP